MFASSASMLLTAGLMRVQRCKQINGTGFFLL